MYLHISIFRDIEICTMQTHQLLTWASQGVRWVGIEPINKLKDSKHSLKCKFFFLSFFKKFIYLFLAVLGLRFCARAFSSCGKRGPLFIAVRRPLTIAAFLVAEHRLQTRRLSSCGSRAQLLRGMWDLPRPGPEPMSPALAGGFSTTAPPGKPKMQVLCLLKWACLYQLTLFLEEIELRYSGSSSSFTEQ